MKDKEFKEAWDYLDDSEKYHAGSFAIKTSAAIYTILFTICSLAAIVSFITDNSSFLTTLICCLSVAGAVYFGKESWFLTRIAYHVIKFEWTNTRKKDKKTHE